MVIYVFSTATTTTTILLSIALRCEEEDGRIQEDSSFNHPRLANTINDLYCHHAGRSGGVRSPGI